MILAIIYIIRNKFIAYKLAINLEILNILKQTEKRVILKIKVWLNLVLIEWLYRRRKIKMEFIKDNGRWSCDMEKVSLYGIMVLYMKDFGKMINHMVLEEKSIKLNHQLIFMKVNLKKVKNT